jgi:nucleotide-binding universal stress UspA family protein
MKAITRILVPIDFGPASDAAVERAVGLATALDAELIVLHVCEVPVYAYPGAPFIPVIDISVEMNASARRGIATVVHQLEPRVRRVLGVVREGSVWREIDDVAREMRADLIVLGTHGRRGVARVILGSVAEKVVRTSPIPVLTVHPIPPVNGASEEQLDTR